MQQGMQQGPTPQPLGIAVVTVSDTRTLETDTSGQVLVEFVNGAGHRLEKRVLVPDDRETIRGAVSACVADERLDVVLLTGGTGITGRDVTVEALAPLLTKEIPGFGELFRYLSFAEIGAATIQSRAMGGVCDATLVFALPGSTGAVRLAVDQILRAQLDVRTRPCNFAQLISRLRP